MKGGEVIKRKLQLQHGPSLTLSRKPCGMGRNPMRPKSMIATSWILKVTQCQLSRPLEHLKCSIHGVRSITLSPLGQITNRWMHRHYHSANAPTTVGFICMNIRIGNLALSQFRHRGMARTTNGGLHNATGTLHAVHTKNCFYPLPITPSKGMARIIKFVTEHEAKKVKLHLINMGRAMTCQHWILHEPWIRPVS
ncbi:hypothetical protein BGZ63DRAFT_189409 [Mariannaea sp. PMI_226]|nr:hypothetical protein BGZ63DRAFT_189409 [Mariannaea sp. PMI_226]